MYIENTKFIDNEGKEKASRDQITKGSGRNGETTIESRKKERDTVNWAEEQWNNALCAVNSR